MSFRASAVMAAVVVVGLGAEAPVSAQPQAPVRPRYSSFGNVFSPRPALGVQGAGAGNLPFINPIGPQAFGGLGGQGFIMPGQALPGGIALGGDPALGGGLVFPGAYAVNPQLAPTGFVPTFNSLGHWYPNGTGGGNLGHWYPGGFAGGRGVLANNGGGGYSGSVGPLVGGGGAGMARPGGSLAGTALGVGAAAGTFRR